MGTRLFGICLVLALFLALAAATSEGAPERLHLVLLHTNDVHGQAQPRQATWMSDEDPPLIGGLPRIAAYVKRVRAEHQGAGKGVLVVDGGDWFQGTPEGLVDRGRGYLKALAAVGYDALCVGNHELDYGTAHLSSLIEDCGLPAVCANVRLSEGGPRVGWAKPWRIIQVAGLRVAMVGLLTCVTPSITHADARELFFQEPAAALAEAREALQGKVDLIVPVTHLGVVGDRRLAKLDGELDLIVVGHSHTYLKRGVHQGETFIVQAGSKASAVGRVDLWFDAETRELVEYEYEMINLLAAHEPEDGNAEVDRLCAALVERSAAELDTVVGELLAPLSRSNDRYRSSPAGNLICDVMRSHFDADIALQNRGGIRTDLPMGAVTRRDLFEILPFGNNLVLLEISGAVLTDCIRLAVEGRAHSGLEVSGLEIVYSEDTSGAGALVGLAIDGEAIRPDAVLRLATNSFLAGGADGYPQLGELKRLAEDPLPLREILEAHLRKEGQVMPRHENRYTASKP